MKFDQLMPYVTRILWVAHHAPIEMKTKVTEVNGVAYGTVSWYDESRRHIRRWTSASLESVTAEFTGAVLSAQYGNAVHLSPEQHEGGKVVIVLTWNGYYEEYFMRFNTVKSMNAWVKNHKDWMEWERLK